jgi:hypothetical protein
MIQGSTREGVRTGLVILICSKTRKGQNLGTFSSRGAAEAYERAVQYFKHQ